MISINRVNGIPSSDMTTLMTSILESSINKYSDYIEESVIDIVEKEGSYIFEASVTEASDDTKVKALQDKQKNVFDKIGEAALAISKKVIELINKVISAIKDISFNIKSDEKKLDVIKKRNPKYADTIIAKINDNELSLADIRGINDIDKMYKEIIEMSKKKDVDPKTLRGKAMAFNDKLKEMDKSGAVTAAKATAAIITVGTGILTIKKHRQDIEKNTIELQKKSKESYAAFLGAYKELKTEGTSGEFVNSDVLTKAQIIQNINAKYQGKLSKLVSANELSMNKVTTGLHNFVKKFDNAGQLISNLEKDLGGLKD